MITLWYVALLSPLIAALGLFFLKITLGKIQGEFKRGMTYLLISASLAVASGIVTIFLVILGLDTSHIIWNSVPIIYLISNIFFIINVRKIEKAFRIMTMEVEGNERKSGPTG